MTHYNNPGLLPNYLTTLEGLNKLLVDRQNAGYVRREPLDPFILKGRWIIDGVGNMGFAQFTCQGFSLVGDIFDGGTLPKIPDIISWEAYKKFAAPWLANPENSFAIGEVYACVPPVGSACCVCGEPYTIETAHTAYSFVKPQDAFWEKRPEFVGLTFPDLPRAFVEGDGQMVKLKATTLIARLNDGRRISETRDYSHIFSEGDAMAYMTCFYTHRRCRTKPS